MRQSNGESREWGVVIVGLLAALAGAALGAYGIAVNATVTAGVGGLLCVAGGYMAWTIWELGR